MERTQVIDLTTENFNEAVLAAPQPVLVDFWAPWCGPCRTMTPVVDALADVFAGRLLIGKVNVDRHPALVEAFGIQSIPTLKLFVQGDAIKTWVGVYSQHSLVRELAKALQSHAAT